MILFCQTGLWQIKRYFDGEVHLLGIDAQNHTWEVKLLAARQKTKWKNVAKVLRQLSEESGIPLGTLKMWWYDQEKAKLENQPNPESQAESNPSDKKVTISDHPTCTVCGERKVQREKRGGKWLYRDKCYKCRTIPTPAYQAEAQIEVLCPLCGGRFKLKKGDLRYEQNQD